MSQKRERGGGSHLKHDLRCMKGEDWRLALVRARFRRLGHCCMVKTARLRDCWSTRRGGDVLQFQAYIPGHAGIMDWDNILNRTDNDVETVLTERGHKPAPLIKRRRDFNSERIKQQTLSSWWRGSSSSFFLQKLKTKIPVSGLGRYLHIY